MRICLFDIDGTLIRSGGAGQEAVLATLSELFGAQPQVDSVPFAGRTDRAIMTDLFRLHDIPWSQENWQRFQRSYQTRLPDFLRQRSGWVLPGVHELLAVLQRTEEAHLGLLTGNVRAGAEQKLRHFSLWEHFQFGGYGDDHVSRDAVAHEALQNAQDTLGLPVDPDDVWVIGDTPSDVACGRAIGARVLAVTTGGYSAEELAAAGPNLLREDLCETDYLLDLLFS